MERCATENELLAFAEGQLRGASQAWVERHIDGCAECGELLAEVLRDESRAADVTDDPGRVRLPGGRRPTELKTAIDGESGGTPPASTLRLAFDGASAQGLRVGRYLLLERLGQGAMGFVYTAYEPELARTVALKLIRPEFDGGKTRGAARARLIREAQAAARIEHPNLVTIYEVGQADDVAYIAMEYVKGQTVRAWIDASARPRRWREVLAVFLQAGAALAAAHRGRVLHRDFKPDNILLDDEGRARVVDFGLAVGVHEDGGAGEAIGEAEGEATRSSMVAAASHLDLQMTATGIVLGTPAYMAPEQHRSARVDARADQYAFAVSLYEALYGARPFAGRNLGELLAAKRADRIHEGGAAVPRWLRAVVVRALASKADARWPDMPAMLAALQADPTRRRAALGVAVTLGAGLLAGLGWQTKQRAEIEAGCVAEGQAIAPLWNDERKAAMQAAFTSTGLPFAGESWRRVAQRMDAWVADYQRARSELCRAGELAGSVEPAVLARGRACFDERRSSLENVTREWAAADIQRVTRAASRAAAFAPLGECTDFPVLARRLAVERAEGVAEVDRARLRGGWQDARRLAYQGDEEGTRRLAHELAEEAAGLNARGIASALSLTECGALRNLQRIDEAQVACERSFVHAVIGSDHEGAFHTAAALSNLASQYRHDRAGAKLWLDLAEAHHTFIAAPAGQPDSALARLRAARAYYYQDFGETAKAVEEFHRGIAAYEALQGEYSEHASYLWMSIAHLATVAKDLTTARDALEHAGRTREAIFGSEHPQSIEVDLARVELQQELDPDSVDASYRQILERAERTGGADSVLAAKVHYQRGHWLKLRQGCAAARPVLERLAQILGELPDARPDWLAAAYVMVATCRLEGGDASAARAAAMLAQDSFGADPEPTPELGEARALLARCDVALAERGER